ncbi:MAG: ABC transporter ATP-binding protein [Nitrospirae bacterium]|nr:ABC transporter ATP-binding protein [Nitrospirota bacterium]
MNTNNTVFKTEGLSKYYNPNRPEEIKALQDINIEIKKGNSTILSGPSGSGKTTLISLLGAIDRPTKGKIFLHDPCLPTGREELSILSDEALALIRRKKIGFIFQDFNLIPRLSAWENVAYPLIPMVYNEKERKERAVALLERLGLGKRINHTPEEMSGGEQQRVSIARALINNPEILIADEPSSNIDAKAIENLISILTGLKEKGMTIIISTHDEVFYPHADIKINLKEGVLINIEQRTQIS